MIRRLQAILELIARRLRPEPPALFRVVYAKGVACECGETSAVLDGKCWYCRTGNTPVKEPMVWEP
jgi:hypothetical protein